MAAASIEPALARPAMETLCSIYWRPIYVYIRGRGNSPEDAQDFTQEFFARVIEKEYLKRVDPAKGRFRSFLLASVNHFLSNERDRVMALKRGGAITFVSLDLAMAEAWHAHGLAQNATPEKLFDRAWALSLLESALERLRSEYADAGKGTQFERLKCALTGEEQRAPYSELSTEMGLSEGAIKVAVHRLRRRYRDLLREEIAQTVAEGEDLEEELRYLMAALVV